MEVRGEPQRLKLPSPDAPIIIRKEPDEPQPRLEQDGAPEEKRDGYRRKADQEEDALDNGISMSCSATTPLGCGRQRNTNAGC